MRLREFDEKQKLEKANEKLTKYKTAAGADATAADASGNFARGNTRFKGINRATKKQFDNDAKLSQLKEFAPSDDGEGPDSDEVLRRIAAHWWNGTEQQMIRAEQTLAAMGWEIGEDEGYDDGGVFVVRAGDEHGRSYISWPHEELELNEVAPPGAKAERMVRHIKQGYARDGKLTPREKSIAFATAWKAHNAGKVEEQGVAEAAKWRSDPDAYDVDDEGNKTPRNPNSPKFGYDPLQRRADTANDAKTPRGKTAALKTSLKMAKGNKGVAEGPDDTVRFEVDSENAYNHVMDQFGSVIDWDGDTMVAPRKYWGAIQELALAASGEASEEQGVAEGSLNEFAVDGGDGGEDPFDSYPCYDCGSTIFLHHTKLCELAEDNAIRDLPAKLGSQHWTGRIPKGLHPIPGLREGVAEGLTEMDKSEPSAGRDTGPREGPDREAKPITAKKATKDAADMLNRAFQDSHKKKDVKEAQLDEFARGEGGYGPFKIYIGHHFTDQQFSTFGAAKEAVGILQNDDPALADGDWRIVNGTGKTVWEHVPAYDDIDESLSEDSLAAMRRLAGIVPRVPAVVPNGPRQYRHMPTAVQPR